jgi:hypothetical protein
MVAKTPILPERVRKVPKSFSWIDHRLVSDKHIESISHAAGMLYLFLVCVGDDKGLSYYGDQSLMEKLAMDQDMLEDARTDLIRKGLIAWQKPLYQVLCLEPEKKVRRSGSPMGLGDILKQAMEACHD